MRIVCAIYLFLKKAVLWRLNSQMLGLYGKRPVCKQRQEIQKAPKNPTIRGPRTEGLSTLKTTARQAHQLETQTKAYYHHEFYEYEDKIKTKQLNKTRDKLTIHTERVKIVICFSTAQRPQDNAGLRGHKKSFPT